MKMRRFAGILSVIFLVGLVQVPLLLGDDGMDREKDLTRVRKKIETLRAWQLTEELDLDEETTSKLFPAMRKADKERWKIEIRNRKLMKEMSSSALDQDPDPRRINQILDELQKNRRELNRIEEKHIERVRQILSPADTARYIMFQIRFQREIKQKAAEAFRDRGQKDMDRPGADKGRDDGNDGDGKSGGGSSSDGGRRRR